MTKKPNVGAYMRFVCITWPPLWAVCMNHDVMVFQPRTFPATYLGSITIFNNFILAPPSPPVSAVSGSF